MFEITKHRTNKDIAIGMTKREARKYYLKMTEGFKSKLPRPKVTQSKECDGKILDCSEFGFGLKAYAAEKFISELKGDTIAYCSPRFGHASDSIAFLAEKYNKRAVFFAPASKEVSAHQAVVKTYKNCELRFGRIPAMRTLNIWIKQWCDKHNYTFIPFGLSDIKLVTAGIVRICEEVIENGFKPSDFHCAVSTGTLIRALKIGWPDSKGYGVAVARNVKSGERGDNECESYHKSFHSEADTIPTDFETTNNYDAKAYEFFKDDFTNKTSLFINVGSDANIERRLLKVKDWKSIDSYREFGDKRDFNKS